MSARSPRLECDEVFAEDNIGEFPYYYNQKRAHASLEGDTPAEADGESGVSPAKIDDFRWQTHCRGMVQLHIAA